MMREHTGLVTFRGTPLTLLGEEVKVGDKAPDFTVTDNNLKPVQFSSFSGKTCILSVVPSLDTPICDMTTRRFNEEAANLGDGVLILTISMDLPFAQARWCGSAEITAVKTLSDHKDASFGLSYGVLIKDLRLLSRAVFVVDKNGTVQYKEIVDEIAKEPSFDAVLNTVKNIM
jgi:thioredoxin-dependent peroxiredoxin